MRNFKDESFIGQYLSPQADARLAPVRHPRRREASELEVSRHPRRRRLPPRARGLSRQYDLGSREPNIQVWNVNLRGDRSLTLRHFQHNDRPLHDSGRRCSSTWPGCGASACTWKASTPRAT
jgi:stage V sporulation protein R